MELHRDWRAHGEDPGFTLLKRCQELQIPCTLAIGRSQIDRYELGESAGTAFGGGIDSLEVEGSENVRPLVGANRGGQKPWIDNLLQGVVTAFDAIVGEDSLGQVIWLPLVVEQVTW